jgi:glycolate oxidase iron-sulfur subunit
MTIGIEEKNAKEEIIEITEKCIKCGLCKELCPVFKVLREEQSSPRGHAILLSNKVFDKIVFDCTLCKLCEEKCPMSLKLCKAITRAREVLNLKDEEHVENKKMQKRIEEKKNPYLD